MVYFIFTQYNNISIFKRKGVVYVYVYNKYYCCVLQINIKIQSIVLVNSSCIKLTDVTKNLYSKTKHTHLSKTITLFLTQFNLLNYMKVKFTGKGYKIRKNSTQSLIFLFNRAHITIIC